jgi:hypothetical protein
MPLPVFQVPLPGGRSIEQQREWHFENNFGNEICILKRKGEAYIMKDIFQETAAWDISKEISRVKKERAQKEADEAAKAFAQAAQAKGAALPAMSPKDKVCMFANPPMKKRKFVR